MYLFKRSNSRFYIRYQQLNGKMTCISTGTKSKSNALGFVSNFRKELDIRESQKTIPIKLKDFFREFLKYSESVHRPKHTETLEASFNVIMRYFGDIALSELTGQRQMELIALRWTQIYIKDRYVILDNSTKLNFHSLRHTLVSWLVQRGVSIYEVSKLLGHSSDLRTDDLRKAIAKLN